MEFDKLDYKKLCDNVKRISEKCSFLDAFSIGKSQMDRDILCIKLGEGNKKIFLNGAHHSLEWITSALLLSFARDYADCLNEDKSLCGKNITELYKKASYYIVPMVNPDGVDIVINGLNEDHPYYKNIINVTEIEEIKTVWQANINGVDLNHNYDALFSEGKKHAKELGIVFPAPSRYPGENPFSEPETIAVKNLCEKEKFDVCCAFHSQGEVIYWDFNGNNRFLPIAERLSHVSGYALEDASGITACSGFKDWIIDKFNIPAFTIEVGHGVNPIPFSQIEKIKKECYPLICELAYV